ncbi:MAG: EAL domain-containing protein, partial [Acidimicrobiia bacterium]
LPIDIVKIDRSFIRATQELSPLVRIILQIGETLRLDIVAEGIETPDELQRLRQLGCRIGQGYHFARPADTDTTTALLTAQPLPAVLAAAR